MITLTFKYKDGTSEVIVLAEGEQMDILYFGDVEKIVVNSIKGVS